MKRSAPTACRPIDITWLERIVELGRQLHPQLSAETLRDRQRRMFELPNYRCFGLFVGDELVGISSGWITIRYYSGRQLEVDNVVIDDAYRSQGLGQSFFAYLESWAKNDGCRSLELNTYTGNRRSHKFYYGRGYEIFGFHFIKHLQTDEPNR